jgi:excisionase family DNA binding protein
MTHFRAAEAAALLGVSDDTVRRWIDSGRLPAVRDTAGRWQVLGRDLAAFAQDVAAAPRVATEIENSADNRLPGLVTAVSVEGLLARVEIQAGPFRLVSVVSSEAVGRLGLDVGVLVLATVDALDVGLEVPHRPH